MSLDPKTIFRECPECGTESIGEKMRVEGGELGDNPDFAVYGCHECGCVFDYVTHPK